MISRSILLTSRFAKVYSPGNIFRYRVVRYFSNTTRLHSLFGESRSGTRHPSQQVDLGDILCDRHARNNPTKLALKYFANTDQNTAKPEIEEKYTFQELTVFSNQLAHFLKNKPIGLKKHDRVVMLLPKSLELMIASLATWRCGGCIVPMFTGFGPDAIRHRFLDSGAKIIITDTANRAKLVEIPDIVDDPSVKIITVFDRNVSTRTTFVGQNVAREFNFWEQLYSFPASEQFKSEPVDQNDNLILMYTAGTSSLPKAVMVPVKALQAFECYLTYGLFVEKDDTYWNVADPGWAYGMYYNVCGTLLTGTTTMFLNDPHFNPRSIFRLIQDQLVTNLAAAPTTYRALMAEGETVAASYNCSSLRKITCVGEPMNPNVSTYFERIWGLRIHEHYGQTEIGMIVCNHHHPLLKKEIRPGSMGIAMPGFQLAICDKENNEVKRINQPGHLAICVNESPLNFFRGYWNNDDKTVKRLVLSPDGETILSLTGDTARMDEDGFFFHAGRNDDIITCSAVRISPREVEDVLLDHPAIQDAGVVGKPDVLRGEVVAAFVVLKANYRPSEPLQEMLKLFVKDRLSKHQYPREIHFVESLPYSANGKLMRGALRTKLNPQSSE
jgi:acetyl-CoA synthetase